MANIPLNKEVYSKTQFKKVVNTNFTQLVNVPSEPTSSIPSVESINVKVGEFFNEYNSLFYDIPKFGNTNSHEYLVKTSGEYIGTISTPDSTVQALIEEINQLRQDNLALQQQITSGSI